MTAPRLRPNKRALGVSTGDIVTTSYNTGPYEVWDIQGPRLYSGGRYGPLFIWRRPHMSLVFTTPGTSPPEGAEYPRINDVVHINGRWFSLGGRDELFVEHRSAAGQISLFGPEEPTAEPYRFQEGVDYDAEGRTWHCWACGRDFNADPTGLHCGPNCPDDNCHGLGEWVDLYPDDAWYGQEARVAS